MPTTFANVTIFDMVQRSLKPKRLAERRYPDHRVEIPAGPMGLGSVLNDMHAWCREHIKSGWERHHHATRRGKGLVPIEFARVCFETDAEAFTREAVKRGWLP